MKIESGIGGRWKKERRKIYLPGFIVSVRILLDGALAQLGERLHGMQEVVGSNPIGSIMRGISEVLT